MFKTHTISQLLHVPSHVTAVESITSLDRPSCLSVTVQQPYDYGTYNIVLVMNHKIKDVSRVQGDLIMQMFTDRYLGIDGLKGYMPIRGGSMVTVAEPVILHVRGPLSVNVLITNECSVLDIFVPDMYTITSQ